jgi:protein-S-isoprenylcysteine O-methyltransferase Ste14
VETTGEGEVAIPLLSALSPALVLNLGPLGEPRLGTGWGVAVAVLGGAIAAGSLLHLRRSFAVLPSVRRLVVSGPYRVLRHPLYLGESLFLVGLVLLGFSWPSIAGLSAALLLLRWRIGIEERKLAPVPGFKDYTARVRWRLVPGVW